MNETEKKTGNPIMKFFAFAHLPPHLQGVSGDVYALACSMDAMLPESAEKSAGLRKLLEAKDCFVRAMLPAVNNEPRHSRRTAVEAPGMRQGIR